MRVRLSNETEDSTRCRPITNTLYTKPQNSLCGSYASGHLLLAAHARAPPRRAHRVANLCFPFLHLPVRRTSAVRSSRRKSSSLLDGTGSCRASEPTTAPGPVAAGPLTGVGAAALGLGAASSGLRATLAARLGIMSANKSSSACSAGDALVVSAGGEGTAFAFTDFPASAVASWGLGSASGAGPRLATRAGSREFGPGSRSAAGGGTGGVSCRRI